MDDITIQVVTVDQGWQRSEQREFLLALARRSPHRVVVGWSRAKPVTSNRNLVVRRFRETPPDHRFLLLLDNDTVPQGDVLKYAALDLDVVVFPAPVWKVQNPVRPIQYNIRIEDEDGRVSGTGVEQSRGQLVEIASGGTAAMLIARRVLEHPAMTAPFIDEVDEDGIVTVMHDLAFCNRARAAGFKVWAALDCPCDHYHEVNLADVQEALMRQEALYQASFSSPRRAFRDKRLIFCLTPGRSGTKYLAQVLGTVPGVAAFHEPQPDFADVMRVAQGDPGEAYRFWLEHKLPAMATCEEPVYAETSHLFCKGFAEPLLHLGLLPDVIVLTRPHRDVASSMVRCGHVPGRTEIGRRYLIEPDDPTALCPVPEWEAWSDYQVCYWYCLEMAARCVNYAAMFRQRGARVVETSLADVTTQAGFMRLLRALDLGWPDRTLYQERRRIKYNRGPLAGEVDLAALEAEERAVQWRLAE